MRFLDRSSEQVALPRVVSLQSLGKVGVVTQQLIYTAYSVPTKLYVLNWLLLAGRLWNSQMRAEQL
jgi:hypothetical protein